MMNTMDNLPDIPLEKVLKAFDFQDQRRMERVCKRWRQCLHRIYQRLYTTVWIEEGEKWSVTVNLPLKRLAFVYPSKGYIAGLFTRCLLIVVQNVLTELCVTLECLLVLARDGESTTLPYIESLQVTFHEESKNEVILSQIVHLPHSILLPKLSSVQFTFPYLVHHALGFLAPFPTFHNFDLLHQLQNQLNSNRSDAVQWRLIIHERFYEAYKAIDALQCQYVKVINNGTEERFVNWPDVVRNCVQELCLRHFTLKPTVIYHSEHRKTLHTLRLSCCKCSEQETLTLLTLFPSLQRLEVNGELWPNMNPESFEERVKQINNQLQVYCTGFW